MRRRAPFVNNEVYNTRCDNIFIYNETCICSKTVYFVLLTIFCTVCRAPSLTFSSLELSMVWKYNFSP